MVGNCQTVANVAKHSIKFGKLRSTFCRKGCQFSMNMLRSSGAQVRKSCIREVQPLEPGCKLVPDSAHNNEFDFAAAKFFYDRVQELGAPRRRNAFSTSKRTLTKNVFRDGQLEHPSFNVTNHFTGKHKKRAEKRNLGWSGGSTLGA